MKHKIEHIQSLKEVLKQMPSDAVPVTELTTAAAVRSLSREVSALRRKGFSFERIAQVFGSHGFVVTARSLRRYSAGSKSDENSKDPKKSMPALRPSAANLQAAPPSVASAHLLPGERPTKQRTGSFIPREDTPDI
jgi:hypothetical protein